MSVNGRATSAGTTERLHGRSAAKMRWDAWSRAVGRLWSLLIRGRELIRLGQR